LEKDRPIWPNSKDIIRKLEEKIENNVVKQHHCMEGNEFLTTILQAITESNEDARSTRKAIEDAAEGKAMWICELFMTE